VLKRLVPWLTKRGVEVYCDPSITYFDKAEPHKCEVEKMPEHVDMGVVLGGDGTMLWAARLFSTFKVPLLGVNLGAMGFITEVALKEIYNTLEQVLSGDYSIEERIMLAIEHKRNGNTVASFESLNDAVVNKGTRATIIDLEVLVDGVFVTRYRADGIIVSSPTGSTAYSLSADGPIVYPTLDGLLLTPICPHTLSNRPIVLPGDAKIEILLKSDSEDVILTYDGLVAGNIEPGDTVSIGRSSNSTRLVMPLGHDHFEALRTKLGWGGR